MSNSEGTEVAIRTEGSSEGGDKKRRYPNVINTESSDGHSKSLFGYELGGVARRFGRAIWDVLEENDGVKKIEEYLPDIGILLLLFFEILILIFFIIFIF